jgi:HEAT repeat protein
MGFIKKTKSPATDATKGGKSRDYEVLIAQLSDDEPGRRRWAARDLVEFPNAATPLLERLQIEAVFAVREAIFTSLARLRDTAAVSGLVRCLSSEDAPLRNEAIEALKALPDEVAPIMSELLRNESADVRILAVNVLESLRHPDVERWLIEVIDHDLAVNVCGCAVDLLAEVGTPAARDALERLQRRFATEPYIQFAAGLALKRIDGT